MTVYSVVGSNATRVTRLMLDLKGFEYEVVTLPNEAHRPMLRMLGFPGKTTPAIRWDGRKLQGSLAITQMLEAVCPNPPLYPAEPEQRAKVEEAERWGDDVAQSVSRRLAYGTSFRIAATLPGPEARANLLTFFEGPLMRVVPPRVAVATATPLIGRTARRIGSRHDEGLKKALAEVPGVLDYVELLLTDGVIGREQPNAGDLAIAPQLRLLMTLDDLRPFIEHRPAGQFALRACPDFPGKLRALLPQDWLAPLEVADQKRRAAV